MDIFFSEEFIVGFRVLTPETCARIVQRFQESNKKFDGLVHHHDGRRIQSEAKKSTDCLITDSGEWRDLFQEINIPILRCVDHYTQATPALQALGLQLTSYKIQMYPKGQGYFDWHFDTHGEASLRRVVAMVLYLNDVAEGGETEFYHQQIRFQPQAGHMILFPTAWMYMHRGAKPVSGDKLIISAFVEVPEAFVSK